MCSATATPTAPTRSSRDEAERFLASVNGWIWKLAHQYHERVRMTVEDLSHEIFVDVLLNLHKYDAARGRPTTWVHWRVKRVVADLRRNRGRFASAVPFSQFDWGHTDDGIPVEDMAVAPHDPNAEAGRLERDEDEAELREAVRVALGCLTRDREADVRALFRFDGDTGTDCAKRGRGGRLGTGVRKLRDVADRRGVTRERARQTTEAGLEQLAEDSRLRELATRHGFATG